MAAIYSSPPLSEMFEICGPHCNYKNLLVCGPCILFMIHPWKCFPFLQIQGHWRRTKKREKRVAHSRDFHLPPLFTTSKARNLPLFLDFLAWESHQTKLNPWPWTGPSTLKTDLAAFSNISDKSFPLILDSIAQCSLTVSSTKSVIW